MSLKRLNVTGVLLKSAVLDLQWELWYHFKTILWPRAPQIRGGICPCRQCRRQCKIFASGVNFSIFTHFFVFFLTKTVEIRWNWWCKIFSPKIRRCKFLDKFHVWGSASIQTGIKYQIQLACKFWLFGFWCLGYCWCLSIPTVLEADSQLVFLSIQSWAGW